MIKWAASAALCIRGMFIAIAEAERPKIQADRDTEELIHDTSASDSS